MPISQNKPPTVSPTTISPEDIARWLRFAELGAQAYPTDPGLTVCGEAVPTLVAALAEREAEITRLHAGWHEANVRVLEVGLERTQLKSRVAELEATLEPLAPTSAGDGKSSELMVMKSIEEFRTARESAEDDRELFDLCGDAIDCMAKLESERDIARGYAGEHVMKRTELDAENELLRERVAALEASARKVCFSPANSQALMALGALLPDQRGEEKS